MHMKIEGKKLALKLDMHKDLSQELRIVFKEDGVHIISVDPAHIAMVNTHLKHTACEEYNIRDTEELEIGIDYVKIRDFLKIGTPSDIFTFDYDPESNRLVARLGNLVRTMGLLDLEGMPFLKTPELTWANKAEIPAKVLYAIVKSILPDGKKIRFSTRRGYLTVTRDSLIFENHSDDEKENKSKRAVINTGQDLISNTFGVPTTVLFAIDDIMHQAAELKRSCKKITIETNGNEDPLRISGANEDMTAEYYHTVIIERNEVPHAVALFEEKQDLTPEPAASQITTEPEPRTEIPNPDPEPTPEPEDTSKKPAITPVWDPVKDWKKEDFGSYAIYHNNKYPDLKIHFSRVKAHMSMGYKYGVWRSSHPCAVFVGGANSLKEAVEVALLSETERIVEFVVNEMGTSEDIGWLASPKNNPHLVGEVIKVTNNTYILLFRGSKQPMEPVEYEQELVTVYRRNNKTGGKKNESE